MNITPEQLDGLMFLYIEILGFLAILLFAGGIYWIGEKISRFFHRHHWYWGFSGIEEVLWYWGPSGIGRPFFLILSKGPKVPWLYQTADFLIIIIYRRFKTRVPQVHPRISISLINIDIYIKIIYPEDTLRTPWGGSQECSFQMQICIYFVSERM